MQDDRGEDGIYDFAAEAKRPAEVNKPRTSPKPIAVLPYRSKASTSAKQVDADTIKNLQMPLWLLGGGVTVQARLG